MKYVRQNKFGMFFWYCNIFKIIFKTHFVGIREITQETRDKIDTLLWYAYVYKLNINYKSYLSLNHFEYM